MEFCIGMAWERPCSGPAICYCAFVMAECQRGVRNLQNQIDLWFAVVIQIDLLFARFTRLSWVLLCISLGGFPCALMCSVFVFRAYLLV